MACSSITLATRAAINGGVAPLTAYAISDLAKQHLEQCKTISEITTLQRMTRIKFASQVKETKDKNQKQSSYTEKCRVYIINHLNKPFTLEDIAEEIGINKTYLSRRFSEEMGITPKQYRNREKPIDFTEKFK